MVVRVNSPGGSAVGSDTLHQAMQRLKQVGKLVAVWCVGVWGGGLANRHACVVAGCVGGWQTGWVAQAY